MVVIGLQQDVIVKVARSPYWDKDCAISDVFFTLQRFSRSCIGKGNKVVESTLGTETGS